MNLEDQTILKIPYTVSCKFSFNNNSKLMNEFFLHIKMSNVSKYVDIQNKLTHQINKPQTV